MSEKVKEVSAGIIPFRKDEEEVEYLLLNYAKGHWSFPKGLVEENEEITEAALRQLKQETSIPPEKVKLKVEAEETIEYTFEEEGEEHKKTVHLYPGEVGPEVEVSISSELKDYWWMPFGEATTQMTYPEPRQKLEIFHKEEFGLDNGEPPIDTSLLNE